VYIPRIHYPDDGFVTCVSDKDEIW